MATKKRRVITGLLLLLSAAIIAGAGYFYGMQAKTENVMSALPRVDKEKVEQETNTPELPESDDSRFIGKSNISKVSEGEWSTVDSFNYDITGDGVNDTITLYTSARSDDMGILWEDSQSWVLEVSDGVAGYYTLDDEFLSNGSVYYNVMERENGERVIVVYKSVGSGTIVEEYVFSKSGFSGREVYNSGSVNSVHSSIPWYK